MLIGMNTLNFTGITVLTKVMFKLTILDISQDSRCQPTTALATFQVHSTDESQCLTFTAFKGVTNVKHFNVIYHHVSHWYSM